MVCLLEILLCFIHIFLWVHFCSCCCTICHLLFVKLLLCVHVQISTVFTIRSIRFLFCYLPHLFFAFHQWSFCWPTFCAMCAAALFSAFCLHIKMREMCAMGISQSLYMGGIVLDGIYTTALSRSGPTY